MFDWASRDGVIGAPWGFFEGEEDGDHIVPYPTTGEIAGGIGGDRGISEKGIDVRGGVPDADVLLSSAFTPHVSEDGRGLCGGRGISEMDPTWSSSDAYVGGDTSAPSAERAVGDLGDCAAGQVGKPSGTDSSFSLSMDGKVELDNNSGVSVDGYEQSGEFFLDCDWASLANFDDPDGIFSDSMFWDGEIGKMDGISPHTDYLNATPQPVPRTEKVTSDVTGENFPSFQKGDFFRKRKHFVDDKMPFRAVFGGEQTSSLSHFSSTNDWSADIETDKVGRRNKSLKSRRTEENAPETKCMQITSMDINSQVPQTECCASVSQLFPSGFHHQDRPGGRCCNLFSQGQYRLANNSPFMFSGPSLMPYAVAGNVDQLFSPSTGDFQVPSRHPLLVNNVGVASGAVHLNPQEKIEKLKRRQQMQAMFAIEMQQKQLNEDIDSTQGSNRLNVCSGQRMRSELVKPMSVEQANLNISRSGNGLPVTEMLFLQLGNIISKLDDNTKICMRDSLFRLARSASERMGAEDRSSMVTCNDYEDRMTPDMMGASHTRLFKLPDAETEPETNRVDRIVALLLFNKQQQTFGNLVSGPSRYKTVNLAQM